MMLEQISHELIPEFCFSMDQGTPEWFALRKTKITATDAPVIMGKSKWKTPLQLYYEKISEKPPAYKMNPVMQRGLDLEPIARNLYMSETGIPVDPAIVIKGWAMASLDGAYRTGEYIVEIKCPGEKDHTEAVMGKVPEHYMPQLQHQMYVCNLNEMHYFSFNGKQGVLVEVKRDQEFIDIMVDAELKFLHCIETKTPPEASDGDYLDMNTPEWQECATQWKQIQEQISSLEEREAYYRNRLIFLSGKSNARGAGVSLCQVNRRGNVDYSNIPELKNVNLNLYRKSSITSWRLTSY